MPPTISEVIESITESLTTILNLERIDGALSEKEYNKTVKELQDVDTWLCNIRNKDLMTEEQRSL